jgi:hypothetical protein
MCSRALLISISVLLSPAIRAGDLYGPFLGIVADPSGAAVRPLRGIPGAATIGDSLDLGANITAVSVAPRQSSAVVTTTSGVQLVTINPDGSLSSTDTQIPAAPQAPAVGFSPSGQTVAVFDGSANAVWHRRPDTSIRIDVSSLPGTVNLLAASDSASPLIAAVLRESPDRLFVCDGVRQCQSILGFGQIADVTFVGATGDLAVADRGLKQILLVHDPLSGAAPVALLDLGALSQAPLRVASSADGASFAVLASVVDVHTKAAAPGSSHPPRQAAVGVSAARKRVVGLLRVADLTWNPVDCRCEASGLYPLSGNAVFGLTQRTDQPLWILDADSAQPRVAFVPAVSQ